MIVICPPNETAADENIPRGTVEEITTQTESMNRVVEHRDHILLPSNIQVELRDAS
jgi:hypothetical protein